MTATMLTSEQIRGFDRDGFLVLPDFVSDEACDALRRRAVQLVDEFEPTERRTVFTTNEQTRSSNEEFLSSGPKVWCFFEEAAFGDDGELTRETSLSVNKIGHAMHDLDPVFEAFSYTPQLAQVAADLGQADALALQSMYIFKQPYIGGEVDCHQDATFLCTEPASVIGFWFAIEDATLDNGCLWAIPGGHRTTLRRLMKRHVEGDDTAGTYFEMLDDAPLPEVGDDRLIPLPVTAGTLIVLHGLLPHCSRTNTSPISRHAYSLHTIPAGVAYPAWNWLQRGEDMPLRPLAAVADALAAHEAANA